MDRWTDEWHRLPLFVARWLRVVFDAARLQQRFFFVFASVGFQSFSGHNNRRPNERDRGERAFTPALVARLAKSPAPLPCPTLHR